MMDALNRKRIWYVLAVAGTAVAVKAFSSTSSVNDLLWILAPTAGLVELVTRSGFEFESYAGYMNRDKTFLIAASCSGINFLITSFLMLAYGSLIRAPGRIPKWSWIPVTAAAAYLTTIIANTVRISTALRIQQVPAETGLISEAQAHRLEGIVVYFGFLVLLYYVSGLSQIGSRDGEQTSWSSIKSLLIPLAFYYSITLGVPLANGAYNQGSPFWEHAAFVLVTPAFILLPFALLELIRNHRQHRGHLQNLQ